jgi:hypothetical protein
VNLSMAACLPAPQDAPLVAGRMAAAGINSVRLHHLDSSNYPRGIWDGNNPGAFHPEALARLDVFIDELARHGIWVNMNLHVGRRHSSALGLPDTDTSMDKMAGIFTPALVEAQKKYARDLLGRVSSRRGVRYADDPVIAFVEITNEDSLFMWDAPQRLPSLPDFYARLLRQRFNDWLRRRYGTLERLDAAWSQGAEPLGDNTLTNGAIDFPASGGSPSGWTLEQHAGSRLTATATNHRGKACVKLRPAQADGVGWHLQFNTPAGALEKGRYYTVRFKAAAEAPRAIACSVGQSHEPWHSLGLWCPVRLAEAWQDFEFGFSASETDTRTRLSFSLGEEAGAVFLDDVELRSGGRTGRRPEENWDKGNVAVFGASETQPRERDRALFLADLEKEYFDGMRAFVRDDLACKALVTGTIVFGPLGLHAQSDMDFVDAHAYWHHPRFPGKPWDAHHWTIEQEAMSDRPDVSTLPRLAFCRLAGKPFTLSEYNHPAPNDYQAECVPIMASFAAAQDWDAVWLYTYGHGQNEWREGWFHGYFDLQANPSKFGFIPAGAAIFRGGGMTSLRPATVAIPDPASAQETGGREMFQAARIAAGIEPARTWEKAWSVSLGKPAPARTGAEAASESSIAWTADHRGGGAYVAEGPGAFVFTGRAARSIEATGSRLEVRRPSFAAVALSALDGRPFPSSRALLVTACGRCENTGMGFSEDRRTLGANWGSAPARIEAVSGRLRIPRGEWKAFALAPDGSTRSVTAHNSGKGSGGVARKGSSRGGAEAPLGVGEITAGLRRRVSASPAPTGPAPPSPDPRRGRPAPRPAPAGKGSSAASAGPP